jgi:hypothetical protein
MLKDKMKNIRYYDSLQTRQTEAFSHTLQAYHVGFAVCMEVRGLCACWPEYFQWGLPVPVEEAYLDPNITLAAEAAGYPLGVGSAVDAEVVVYGGLDPVTDELIQAAREAAEVLERNYGAIVIVEPRIVSWSITPNTSFAFGPELPVLEINGIPVVEGRAATPEEIVDYVLSLLGERGRMELPPRSVNIREHFGVAAVVS